MRSLDGGNTWDMLPGFPRDFYITAILELSSTNLLVSAQSNLYNRSDAGIWQSRDDGYTFTRTLNVPTFTLTSLKDGIIVATHAHKSDASLYFP